MTKFTIESKFSSQVWLTFCTLTFFSVIFWIGINNFYVRTLFIIPLYSLFLIHYIQVLTYKIVISDGGVIQEKGWLTKNRQLKITDIINVEERPYYISRNRYTKYEVDPKTNLSYPSRESLSSIFKFNNTVGIKYFPRYPVDSNLIAELKNLNPELQITTYDFLGGIPTQKTIAATARYKTFGKYIAPIIFYGGLTVILLFFLLALYVLKFHPNG